jgi:hypothetical protein
MFRQLNPLNALILLTLLLPAPPDGAGREGHVFRRLTAALTTPVPPFLERPNPALIPAPPDTTQSVKATTRTGLLQSLHDLHQNRFAFFQHIPVVFLIGIGDLHTQIGDRGIEYLNKYLFLLGVDIEFYHLASS